MSNILKTPLLQLTALSALFSALLYLIAVTIGQIHIKDAAILAFMAFLGVVPSIQLIATTWPHSQDRPLLSRYRAHGAVTLALGLFWPLSLLLFALHGDALGTTLYASAMGVACLAGLILAGQPARFSNHIPQTALNAALTKGPSWLWLALHIAVHSILIGHIWQHANGSEAIRELVFENIQVLILMLFVFTTPSDTLTLSRTNSLQSLVWISGINALIGYQTGKYMAEHDVWFFAS